MSTGTTQERHLDTGPYLTTRDVQTLIRVDKSTIYRMAESGRIPAVKVGRQWRFPAEEISRWLRSRANGVAAVEPRPFPREEAQDLVDLFADLYGVMAVVTDLDGRPLTEVSNPCGFFRVVLAAPQAVARCVAEWRAYGGEHGLEPRLRTSHLGFLCARAFVRVGNRLEAMVLAGCIAPDEWPPDERALEAIAAETGIAVDALTAHVEEIHHLPADRRPAVLRGLSILTEHLSRLATGRRAGATPPPGTAGAGGQEP